MDLLRELTTAITRHVGPDPTASWRKDNLGLFFSSISTPPEPSQQIYDPVFALVVQGRKRIALGDQVFEGGAGTFMVVSVELPLTFQIVEASKSRPYVAIGFRIRAASVASLLLEAPAESVPTEATGIGVSQATSELLEPLLRLVRLLDKPRDIPVLWPIVEKEILWRILCSDQGPRLRQIGLADSRLSQIGRAMRMMREKYQETLTVEELARVAAMSVTSFHRHFRAVALMSPLQYQKQIRLHEARARLLTNAQDVAAVGQAVGYDSPSQFSREYKRAYGAPPGQDARTLRASHALSPPSRR